MYFNLFIKPQNIFIVGTEEVNKYMEFFLYIYTHNIYTYIHSTQKAREN